MATLKVDSAHFIKSATRPGEFPRDGLPEIAFVGRSNIGKSSLLNALAKSRGLARTSSSPGRTQTINFFLINACFYFVDLPGYGYARISKQVREGWQEMVEGYLGKRAALRHVLLLVDSRVPPGASDLMMKEWLDHYRIPGTIVLTKADKLTRNELTRALRGSAEILNTKEIVPFSAVTGLGTDKVWARILTAIH